MFNRRAKGMKVEILSSGGKEAMENKFEDFISAYSNCHILDIKVSECEDSYTMWIFYEE